MVGASACRARIERETVRQHGVAGLDPRRVLGALMVPVIEGVKQWVHGLHRGTSVVLEGA